MILSIVIFPEFGLYNPKINLNKVLLPIPDSPFIPVILFSVIFNDISGDDNHNLDDDCKGSISGFAIIKIQNGDENVDGKYDRIVAFKKQV